MSNNKEALRGIVMMAAGLLLFSAAGCSQTTTASFQGAPALPPVAPDQVELYYSVLGPSDDIRTRISEPTKPYEILGSITIAQSGMFFPNQYLAPLRKAAAERGCDGVIRIAPFGPGPVHGMCGLAVKFVPKPVPESPKPFMLAVMTRELPPPPANGISSTPPPSAGILVRSNLTSKGYYVQEAYLPAGVSFDAIGSEALGKIGGDSVDFVVCVDANVTSVAPNPRASGKLSILVYSKVQRKIVWKKEAECDTWLGLLTGAFADDATYRAIATDRLIAMSVNISDVLTDFPLPGTLDSVASAPKGHR